MSADLDEVRDFLNKHAPFGDVSGEQLNALVRQIEVAYVRRGTAFASVAKGVLFILRSGAAEVRDASGTLLGRLEPGESFGYAALLTGETRDQVSALEDSLVYLLPEKAFHALRRSSASFAQFYSQVGAERVRSASAQFQKPHDDVAFLTTQLGELVLRAPVTIPAHSSVREAAQRMEAQGVSSLIVGEGTLEGILTDRDLRGRVVAQGRAYDDPVSTVMTRGPVTLSRNAYAFEALLEMTRHNVHHLPLMDGPTPVGMVTATDLIRLQTANPVYLVGDIRKQKDVAGLVEVSRRLPGVVQRLVEADATAADIGRVVTTLGDALEKRLLDLAEAALGPPPLPYVWLVLGSQARSEQSAHSDQDNALLLGDETDDTQGAYFSNLAAFVSDGLAACGYRYCPGEVMATNERWRQPVSVWQRYFGSWILRPEPEALLNSSIFFDMRALHGELSLFERLHEAVLEQTQTNRTFLAHMAKNALRFEPPLGFFKTFVLERGGEHRNTLDLKHRGVVPIVDVARVYALAAGLPALNTQDRLVGAAQAGALSAEGAANLRDALEFISYVRLRHQGRQVKRGEAPDNFVAPDDLSPFEKRHLKDAFQIVKGLQNALAHSFQLRFLG